MVMRPTTDPYSNPYGLLDNKFNETYQSVKEVHTNLPVIKHISNYMKELHELHKYVDALAALGSNLSVLTFIKNNFTSLTNYFVANDALINSKASTTTDNTFEGFTALGANAPKVKHKRISFQTGAIGTETVVPHLLNMSNILDYSTVVSTSDNKLTKPDKDIYTVSVNTNNITLKVSDTSVLAAGRTCKMLFTYSDV